MLATILQKQGAGEYVVISVARTKLNSNALYISALSDRYVPGATKVVLKGKITSVNGSVGTLFIGKQAVDYTGLLASGTASVKVGDDLTIVGTQPAINGVVLAETIR
jgi:hypothetical protein